MRAWWIVVIAGAVGCKAAPVEGATPGDCEDQADNDADGFFDCDDNGCWGAPTCSGSGTHDTDPGVTDTDVGGGDHTDPPADSDPVVVGDGVNADLLSFAVTYEFNISWDQAGEVSCNNYMVVDADHKCDCTAVYHGTGQLQEVEETRNLYWGTWERVSSNCATGPVQQGSALSGMSLDQASVYSNATGEMFHTWRFSSDGTQAKQWVTHEEKEMDTPCELTSSCIGTAVDNGHFWIVFNRPNPVIDPGTLSFQYKETDPWYIPDLLSTATLRQFAAATFSKTNTPPAYPEIEHPTP